MLEQRTTTSSRVLRQGFTVVELLVTIVILSILIGIAVDSVDGYQSMARDRERAADIDIIASSLERYYRTNAVATGATYPASTVSSNTLKGIVDNPDALAAPEQKNSSLTVASSNATQNPGRNQYIYQPLNSNGSLCTSTPCIKYKLYYKLEVSGAVVTENSMRQQ